MQNLIHSDVFFFITSIAVIVVTIFILIILWYVFRILKNIKDVSDIIKKESFFVLGDLSGIRTRIKSFLNFFILKYNNNIKVVSRKNKIKSKLKDKEN